MTRLRKTIISVIVVCSVFGAALGAIFYNEYRIYFRSVPHGYESEATFFELLQWPNEPENIFNPADAPRWDIEKLEKYIPSQGMEFVDVNDVMVGKASRDEILQNLRARDGEWFKAFAHLSHIYSVPYKQYSELNFSTAANGLVQVNVASWYKPTFRTNDNQSVIVRWEYQQVEGD